MSSTLEFEEISLQSLFSRVLNSMLTPPLSQNDAESHSRKLLADVELLSTRLYSLHLFSSNEKLDDVTTHDLVFMSVPYVHAEVELSIRTREPQERQAHLNGAETRLRYFTYLLDDYQVIPEEERVLYRDKSSLITNPAKRRELKIAQFRKEREMMRTMELSVGKDDTESGDMNLFTLIAQLMSETKDDGNRDEETNRKAIQLLLRLLWLKANVQLESIKQELELLCSLQSESGNDHAVSAMAETTWKLDVPTRGHLGPLLDGKGRPMRPFTILPQGSSSRSQIQAEVFQPDHRLPTMTIDDYLEEERRRGNIISGGGPQSKTGTTKREQRRLESENNGISEADEKSEQQRQEDERWARFKEENPRGAGNTMNRG